MNKIYIKLIDVKHHELEDFIEKITKNYGVNFERNKDTYSIVEQNKDLYLDILDFKEQFAKKGKLIMVYKGGL